MDNKLKNIKKVLKLTLFYDYNIYKEIKILNFQKNIKKLKILIRNSILRNLLRELEVGEIQ